MFPMHRTLFQPENAGRNQGGHEVCGPKDAVRSPYNGGKAFAAEMNRKKQDSLRLYAMNLTSTLQSFGPGRL